MLINLIPAPLRIYALVFVVLSALGAFGWYTYKIYNAGYDKRTSEYVEAQRDAEEKAIKNITETKKEAQIVYKYIKSQKDNCDIYSNVIERLPDPVGGE